MEEDGIDKLMQGNGKVSEQENWGDQELQQQELRKLKEQLDPLSMRMAREVNKKQTKKEKAAAEEAAAWAQEENLSLHERGMSPAWRRLYATVRKYQSK